ncbi:CRE-BLI-4 protein [Aphelenchoides avenae]|nr:CRE-BLI-4 protein [Aphelenchus avenae]
MAMKTLSKKATVTVPKDEVTITFGDLRSAPDCHPECNGCTESKSATACFACKHFTESLRNRAGFRCVPHCDDGFYADGDKCKKCSVKCHTCSDSETCETCPGAQLLVDVDHFGHKDHHGKCVKQCPTGLIPDYTNLIQARCVLKKNPCSEGYYQDIRGQCSPCDAACATCHGAGAIQCDSCADGFGNRSIGYCRPCCATNQTQTQDGQHCEDCSAGGNRIFGAPRVGTSIFGGFVIVVFVVIVGSFVVYMFVQLFRSGTGGRSDLEYTPLNTAEMQARNDAFDYDYESDSDDGLGDPVAASPIPPKPQQNSSNDASQSSTTNTPSPMP